ncbi:phage tail protein [Pandoraea apista]|uniref:phage tail protein n=1 Tax=Pandoraea apista TaxID=93218 RepID=UPI000F65F3DE|nr:phage tail protein [Pandoraea apista]RRW94292.1 phage tail protein [Pandoraea apista]RRX00650.1 phage tail protein [Pandoraea apista]
MKKPNALRAALVENNHYLRQNPGKLHIFVDHGRLEASSEAGKLGSKGGSFRYSYTLNIIVTDYPYDSPTLMMPIIAWVRDWQPELLANPERQRDGIKFEADILNDAAADVSIEIQLTEAVDVQYVEGKPEAVYRAEPMLSDDVRDFLGTN